MSIEDNTGICTNCDAAVVWVLDSRDNKVPMETDVVDGFALVSEDKGLRALPVTVHVAHFCDEDE